MITAQVMTLAPSVWMGLTTFLVLWVGTLVWWSAKMTAYREKTEVDIVEIRRTIESLSKQNSERSTYNEEHYVSLQAYQASNQELCRRLLTLEDIKLGERLATIEANQGTQADTLFQIQNTLTEMQKSLRK